MPFKNAEKTQKIVNIQKRIVKQLFLKTDQFNEEIKHISTPDKTEFNELFAILQKEFSKNKVGELLAQLVLWKKTFLKLEEMCEKTNIFEKLEKMAQINDPIILKAFTKYAKNIIFLDKNSAENLFSFFYQEKNKVLIEWLMANESFLTLCAYNSEQSKKLTLDNNSLFVKPPLPIVTKNFLQAIENEDLDMALFLLEKEHVWISMENNINDEIMTTVLNSNHPPLIKTLITNNFLQQHMKKKLTKYNAKIANFVDQKIFVYLRNFIITNKPEIVTKLFDNGLPINFTGHISSEITFLMAAIFEENVRSELVELLVDKGANLKVLNTIPIGEKQWREVNPLILAITKHHYNLAHLLINLNENIVLYNNCDNVSPLMFLIYENGPHDLIEKIVATKRETLYAVQKSSGYTPLLYAISTQNVEVTKILLAADPKLANKAIIVDNIAFSPLMAAITIKYMNHEIIELLLQKGAAINYQIPKLNHSTAFFRATLFNAIDLMELLKDRGADINVIDGSYLTPLGRTLLSKEKNLKVVHFFAENNITLNTLSADGHTMLTLASKNCNTKFVQQACETYKLHGIDVNIGDKDGNTPLHWALKTNNIELVKMLIGKYNAKIGIFNNEGVSALDLGYTSTNEEIKNLFNGEDSTEKVAASSLALSPVFTNSSPIDNKCSFYFRKQKNELGAKSSSVKPSNDKKSSHCQAIPTVIKPLEREGTKKTNATTKWSKKTSCKQSQQPASDKIVKSLNYMTKKEIQDRAIAEEQKRRKATKKENVEVEPLESEERNLSILGETIYKKEYYSFLNELQQKLAKKMDRRFFVLLRSVKRDHELGRPCIIIYDNSQTPGGQLFVGVIYSKNEQRLKEKKIKFRLRSDTDSFLGEFDWVNKDKIIKEWLITTKDGETVQPKIFQTDKNDICAIVGAEDLEKIFTQEFIEFNKKQSKITAMQEQPEVSTSTWEPQAGSSKEFVFPDSIKQTTTFYENDDDFYYRKAINVSVNKKLNIEVINEEQEQVVLPQKLSFMSSSITK